MLKLKLQYFGHLMRRADSFEKTLMLGKIEGRRRRGWQRIRWLDGITDSMDMSFSKLPESVIDREAWHAVAHGITKSGTWLSDWTELIWYLHFSFWLASLCIIGSRFMSNSLQPHGLKPSRLLHPWDFPGKNTGVVCHFFFKKFYWSRVDWQCPVSFRCTEKWIIHFLFHFWWLWSMLKGKFMWMWIQVHMWMARGSKGLASWVPQIA